MAQVIGCICTSHVSEMGAAMAGGLESDPYWQPVFAAYPPVRAWLEQTRPDVAVVFYNDHGLNLIWPRPSVKPRFCRAIACCTARRMSCWTNSLTQWPREHGNSSWKH